MTENEKYNELLKGLGELIAQKNYELRLKEYEIESLHDRLSDAEQKIEEMKKGN